jgi:hypothetical protein
MIYIVVRRTTDWNDEAAFLAQVPTGFCPSVALWNETVSMPYHIFRRELSAIAGASWMAVTGATVVPLADVPPDGLVVPTDDDDWFAPHMAVSLEAARQDGVSGCYWRSDFIEVPISLGHRLGLIRKAIFPSTPPKWICTTNNYAVVNGPAAAPCVNSHVVASGWFTAHPEHVRWLDAHLSVMNRTMASQTSFRSVASRAAFRRKFRRYQVLYARPLPEALAWARPYVGKMADLMSGVRLR